MRGGGGCAIDTSLGFPVLLRNSADIAQVDTDPGFTAFENLGGSNTLDWQGPSAALVEVDGTVASVDLHPAAPRGACGQASWAGRPPPGFTLPLTLPLPQVVGGEGG